MAVGKLRDDGDEGAGRRAREKKKKKLRRKKEERREAGEREGERSVIKNTFFLASSYSMQPKIAANYSSKVKIFSYAFTIVEQFLYFGEAKIAIAI